jgi:hypothetical protein
MSSHQSNLVSSTSCFWGLAAKLREVASELETLEHDLGSVARLRCQGCAKTVVEVQHVHDLSLCWDCAYTGAD